MMNIYKKLLLVLLMCGACSQNVQADDTQDLAMNIAKGTAGALIGGGVCYWLSQFCQSDLIAEHELKMKFLDDLILFIQSSDYSQGDSSRVFTHYYNALNQFVQSTRSVEIDLLHEFADCRSDFERELLLHKVQDIQVQLQTTHESNIKIGKYILAIVGAFVGGLIPFAGQEHDNSCGCGHHHHSTTYVGSFARAAAPATIFSRK